MDNSTNCQESPLGRVMRSLSAQRLAALAYTVALLLLLFPLLSQSVDPMWDAFDMGYPAFTYLADSIREGRLPLWDPYTNCGLPFHADPSSLTLNPVAIFFSVLFDNTARAFLWFWVFYWWLGGFGLFWLARHYGAKPSGAFVAAIAYALSGYVLAHAEHTSFIIVAACLPWVVLFAERAVSCASIGYALLAGATIAFCTFTGYPGLTLFACLYVVLWLTLRFLPRSAVADSDFRPLAVRLRWIVITLAVMAAVFVIVWSPTLHAFLVEGRGYTDRVDQLALERATGNEAFTFTAAISLFFPFATVIGRSWMGCDISMSNAYMGILTIPLAIFWLWKSGWRRWWWLVVIVIVMFVVSLGGKYGLRTLLYYVYPPTRYMQFNAPFRLFWIFPVCLAAGLGLSRLVQQPEEAKALLRVLLGWSAGAVVVAIIFANLATGRGTPYLPDAVRLFVPAMAILAISIGILGYGSGTGSGVTKRSCAIVLAIFVLVDMSLHLFNNSMTVWNPQTVSKMVEADHQRSTRVVGPPPSRLPGMPFGYFNAQQIVKVPLVRGYVTMKSTGFDEGLLKSRFTEVLSSPYRFWLSPGIEVARAREQILTALAGTGSNAPVPVFVEEPVGGLPAASVTPGSFGAVNIDHYAPEEISMRIRVPGSFGALLASTERYAAGWQVWVDGIPQPALKVNLYFRGVYVPPGEHTVVWRYQPRWWKPLVWLSYITLLSVAATGGWLIWTNKS